MDVYAENILDHYRHPRNSGTLNDGTVHVREENASCGDDIELDIKVEDDHIKAVAWKGKGCAISQAAMSLLSEELTDMSVTDAKTLAPEYVHKLLGVPVGARREKCAMLGLMAVRNALGKIEN
jgi:nitrogen fixation NifU-like protein